MGANDTSNGGESHAVFEADRLLAAAIRTPEPTKEGE